MMGKTLIEQPISLPFTSDTQLLRQKALILAVTESICNIMQKEKITNAELAKRIGCFEAWITRLLNGTALVSLRRLADIADALGYRVKVTIEKGEQDNGKI